MEIKQNKNFKKALDLSNKFARLRVEDLEL